jgi:hypothetical protein
MLASNSQIHETLLHIYTQKKCALTCKHQYLFPLIYKQIVQNELQGFCFCIIYLDVLREGWKRHPFMEFTE